MDKEQVKNEEKWIKQEDGQFGLFDKDRNPIQLPSQLQPQQVGRFSLYQGMEPLTCTVVKVHFTNCKVFYDLEIWLPDFPNQPINQKTRLYNVDSCFVFPA